MISKVKLQTELDITIIERLPLKQTARGTQKYICKDKANNQYILIIAQNEIANFYLNYTLEQQLNYDKLGIKYFKTNTAIYSGTIDTYQYVIYKYFEKLQYSKAARVGKILESIYMQYKRTYQVCEDLVRKILKDFLGAWPKQFHEHIENMALYKAYEEKLYSYKELDIMFEHGDFTANNIQTKDDMEYYLFDFEFYKSFQPVGHDLFDWKESTRRPIKGIPYFELNVIKHTLINEINEYIDKYVYNNIFIKEGYNTLEGGYIYNRFDIIYNSNVKQFSVKDGENSCSIFLHYNNKRCVELGVWLLPISELAFQKLIAFIFGNYKEVQRIYVRYSYNFYNGLQIGNHWKIELPKSIVEFEGRISKKARYNIKREKRILRETQGEYKIVQLKRSEISNDIVKLYFKMKKDIQGTEYNLSPEEYLNKFLVSDAYFLQLENKIVSILFSVELDGYAYLENLSHDVEFEKFSVGKILYYEFLKKLIETGTNILYLGNGNQEYKKYYGSVEDTVYEGVIYRKSLIGNFFRLVDDIVHHASSLLNNLKRMRK